MIKSWGHVKFRIGTQLQISHPLHTRAHMQSDAHEHTGTHTHCPDGTVQGHSRKWLQMATDATEGLEDSSHVSVCIYASMYLCKGMAVILALSWHRQEAHSSCWPKWFLNGHLASWLDPSPAGCLWRALTKEIKEGNRGGLKKQIDIKNQSGCHTLTMFFHSNLNLSPQGNLFLYEMKTQWRSETLCLYAFTSHECVLFKPSLKKTKKTQWSTL